MNAAVLSLLLIYVQVTMADYSYVGCFQYDHGGLSFNYTPGDYDVSSVSPLSCMHLCSSGFKYSTIIARSSCLCSNEINHTALVSDSYCRSQCKESWDRYTSHGCHVLYHAVYGFTQGITGLTLSVPKEVGLLVATWITSGVFEKDGVLFRFEINNKVVSPFSNSSSIWYVFNEKGKYLVGVTARNKFSSMASVDQIVEVYDMFSDVKLQCPVASVPGKEVNCKGIWNRGTFPVCFDFGDGQSENVLLDTPIYKVGPSINQSQEILEKDRVTPGTFVLTSANIPENGELSYWELLATKPGKIRVQIFRPFCQTSDHSCRNQTSNTSGENSETTTCDAVHCICLPLKKCVPVNNAQQLSSNCTESRENVTTLDPDYKLISDHVLDIPNIGYHVFTIPHDKRLTVSGGEVLGWSSEGGDLAYTREKGSAYEYSTIGPTGSELLRSKSSMTLTRTHALSAYIRQPITFEVSHTYAKPGVYQVTSPHTRTLLVNIDHHITPFVLNLPKLLITNSTVTLLLSKHNGSLVNYYWHFGDGSGSNSTIPQTTHVYHYPGWYTITLTATNGVSNYTLSSSHEVLDPIKNCSFKQPITAVILGNPSFLEWKCTSGSNVTFSMNFGDGTTQTFRPRLKEIIGNYITRLYINAGHYSVEISVLSPVGPNSSFIGHVFVEVPITGLQLRLLFPFPSPFLYIANSSIISLEREFLSGTHARCVYEFGDNTPRVVTRTSRVNHTYHVPGVYHVNTKCSNHVSSRWALLNSTIVVQNLLPLKNITLTVSPAVLGTPSIFTLEIHGNLFKCRWDFGDGQTLDVNFPLVSRNFSHTYDEVGPYTVNVTCRNDIGYSSVVASANVDEPIQNATIVNLRQYVSVNQSADFLLSWVKGTRISYCIDCNLAAIVVSNNVTMVTIRYVYFEPGIYDVVIRIWNSVSSVVVQAQPIIVEYPVTGVQFFTVTPSRCPCQNIGFCLNISRGIPHPTNASAFFNFGNGTHTFLRNINFTQTFCLQKRDYSSSGGNDVAVYVTNHVNSQFLTISGSITQKQLKGINAVYNNGSLFRTGLGPGNQYFPLGTPIRFALPRDRHDVSYEWRIGNELLNGTYGSIAEKSFESPGCYHVRTVIKNSIVNEDCDTSVCIQKEINEIVLNVSRPTFFMDYTVFTFSTQKPDIVACFLLNFGDNSSIKFGDASCGFSYQKSTNYSHLYKAKGKYTARLEAWNNVSSVQRFVEVEVWDEACPGPKMHISGGGPQHRPYVVRNAKEIGFESIISYKCLVADVMTIKWQLFVVNRSGGKGNAMNLYETFWRERKVSGESSTQFEKTSLMISARSLPTESFMVQLSIGFIGTRRELSHVNASNYTWFNVVRSKLVARIKGGISLSVPYNSTLVLDGRESYDPDKIFDLNSLTFSWTCRPVNISQNVNKSNQCFKENNIILSNATIISFTTADLVRPQIYVFGLEVKEGTRRSFFEQTVVVVEDPVPRLDIRCVINCEETVDPSQRLVLQSQHLNGDKRLNYKWSIYTCSMASNTTVSLCKEIVNFGKNTSTGVNVANLAILPNVLEIATVYRVRCSAWRPGREYTVGFVEHLFQVNSPPTGGYCMVEPTIGEAMVTMFNISCMNWYDKDQPLAYSVEIKTSTMTLLVSSGNEANVTMFLPKGKMENNFIIEVIIKVVDSLLFSSNSVRYVQVLQPRFLDYDHVVDDLQKTLDNKENNVGFGVVISLCSILNNQFSVFKPNISGAKQTRTKIAKMLGKVNVTGFDEFRGLGISLQTLSAKADEVDPETQWEITKIVKNKMAASHVLSETSRDIVGIGTSFQTVMSNVIEAVLFQSPDNTTTWSTELIKNSTNTSNNVLLPAKESKRNIIKNALFTIDEVNNVILSQIVTDDRPTKIETTNFNVHLTRNRLEELSYKYHETTTLPVKFQDITSFLGNNNLTLQSPLGCLITDLSKNFGIFNSAEELNSNILRVNMKDKEGAPVDLTMLDVEIIRQNSPMHHQNSSQNFTLISEKSLKVHTFNRTMEDTALVVQLEPIDASLRMRAFLSIGQRSTLENHDFRADFPMENVTSGISLYTWVLSHDLLPNFTSPDFQQYFLAVGILGGYKEVNYTLRMVWTKCLMLENEEGIWNSKGCKVGLKSTLRQTHCICRPGQPDSSSEDDGRRRQRRSSKADGHSSPRPSWRNEIFKISIGAGVFPPPNKIDFQYVFDKNLSDNPLALIAVASVFGIFLILLIYARRQDRKDAEKFGVAPLLDNNPSDQYFYELILYTGSSYNAGTTANVSIVITGEDMELRPRALYHPKRKCFQRGGIDTFLLSSSVALGKIHYIQIWHDNGGQSPSWLLDKALVRDLNSKKTYLFLNEIWLTVEKGNVQTVLFPVTENQMKSFKLLFNTTSQRSLKDRHLWFSVFTRPVDSRFTRVQRLACCLTLLYCTMLANAMFYQIGSTNTIESTVTIGPFRFGLNELGIGLMSALVILPFNAILVWVFRNIEAKPSVENIRVMKEKSKIWWFYELFFCCFSNRKTDVSFLTMISRITKEYYTTNDENENIDEDDDVLNKRSSHLVHDMDLDDMDLDLVLTETPTTRKKIKKRATLFKLPYCYAYVAWFALSLVCFTCAFFVVLYGLQFGKNVSARWFSSMTISFFQDVLISEPIKVFAIATVVAVIIKRPQNLDRVEEQERELVGYQKWMNCNKETSITLPNYVKPPDKKGLEKAREKRLKELEMSSLLKELVLYILFVVCLSVVTYNNKNPMAFQMNKAMTDVFVQRADNEGKSFDTISDIDGAFSWLNDTLLHGIYSSSSWYNGRVYPEGTGTIALGNLYLIGKTRIRQTRVKQNTCSVPKYFHDIIMKCHGSYSDTNKDTGCYGIGWTPIANRSLCNPESSLDPWKYYSCSRSGNSKQKLSSLHEDGFMFDLSRANRTESSETLASLQENHWADERTRNIIIEVNVYSGSLNLFCLGNLLIKLHPTNGITKHSTFMVTKLFALSGVLDSFYVISHLFIFFFFVILAYHEAKQAYRLKRKYFSSFWNCLQCLIILLTTACIAMFFVRLLKIEQLLTSLETHGDVISFSHVAFIDMMFGHMIAVIVFLVWLCVIKLLRFNQRLLFLQETLRRIAKPLGAFSVVFFTLFVAYLHSGYLLFCRDLTAFRDLPTVFVTLSSLLMGHLDYTNFAEGSHLVLCRIFVFAVMFFGLFIFVNFFIALILESFMLAKAETKKKANEYELLDFVISQLRAWIGITSTQTPPDQLLSPTPPEDKHGEEATKFSRRISDGHVLHEVGQMLGKTDQSVYLLEDMLERIFQEDWDEEVALYKILLSGRTSFDWSHDDVFSEFWRELKRISGYFESEEMKPRDMLGGNHEPCEIDGIELCFPHEILQHFATSYHRVEVEHFVMYIVRGFGAVERHKEQSLSQCGKFVYTMEDL